MGKRDKILVVDDERSICQNVGKILAKNDYDIVYALSAKEALERMASESFSLLISDIVMPETNGLELLKMVKKQWPLTKVLMITAYASIDTAMKAIRLGALDYLPKPFTPEELRSRVERALSGQLVEAPTTEKEREAIEVIDVDIPFDRDEVEQVVGEDYARRLGPSDMPVVEAPTPETLPNYCLVGERVCEIFEKLSGTCKAGVKTKECPKNKAEKKRTTKKGFDRKKLIGIDEPFNYEEVVAITGPEYVENLWHEGFSFVPYEQLKENVTRMMRQGRVIDRDIPFDRDEVAKVAGEPYAKKLGPSDMPIVEVSSAETLENYCAVGQEVCDIFKKLGTTCKAGVKTGQCPKKKAKTKKAALKRPDPRKLIGVDMPFDYKEVEAITGPEYVANLGPDGIAIIPYEELKKSVALYGQERKDEQKTKAFELIDENRILVIDDEPAVNNNIRKILSKKGYDVDQAITKEEALEKITQRSYRIVLLDLKMPGVKGLELLKAIKDKRPEAMVIIITGYASIETAVESARLGAVDYLPKPFTPGEIRDVTERAFRLAA